VSEVTPNAKYVIREEWGNPPEPAPKHGGPLGDDDAVVQYAEKGVYISYISMDEYVYLSPKQALSLLAWLKQEEAELQRLAKEQAE
jgi:hypothetical protein